MHDTCKLSALPLHQTAVVDNIQSQNPLQPRLKQLGFVSGAAVTPLLKSMLGDPVAYQVNGCVIALRRSESDGVTVRPEGSHAV